jgi:hypothetical protein
MSTKVIKHDLLQLLLDESYDFRGAETGFNERADVIQAADGTDLNTFWAEVQDTIRLRNEQRNTFIDQISYRITDTVEQVTAPSAVDFERATEYGQPVGIRGGATRNFRGFDFEFYDLAIRYTWMALAEMDQNQLRLLNNLALEADQRLQYRKVMERLFYPLNKSGFTDKNEPVTVYAAYNGDGEVPPDYNYQTFNGSHNHYLISGNTAVTSANLDTIANATQEHGFTLQRGYTNILWVNKQEADIIKGFRVANGAKFDFVANPSTYDGKIWVPNTGQYVGGPTSTVPGEIGTYGSVPHRRAGAHPCRLPGLDRDGRGRQHRQPGRHSGAHQPCLPWAEDRPRSAQRLPAGRLVLPSGSRYWYPPPRCHRPHAGQGLRQLRGPGCVRRRAGLT